MREDDFELTFDLDPPAEDHEPSAAASEVLLANSRSRLAEGLQFIQR